MSDIFYDYTLDELVIFFNPPSKFSIKYLPAEN